MRGHTPKNTYLHQRLKILDIPEEEYNHTFSSTYIPYFEHEMYNKTMSERTPIYERGERSKFDNILITYLNVWGESNAPYYYYKPKHNKWKAPHQRIRFNPNNQFEVFNERTRKTEKSAKYKTGKGMQNRAFFNGLYAYYTKPLTDKGYTEQKAIKQLKPCFKKIAITEGEFKAFTGCKIGLPTIGVGGIHNAVKTIKRTVNKGTSKEFQITEDANFLPEILEFIKTFEVREIMFLMDGDAFDNRGKADRAKSFFGAVRNFYFAAINAEVKMTFSYINPNAEGKGLDDLILAKKWNRAAIKANINHIQITEYSDLDKLQFSFAESTKNLPNFFTNAREIIKLNEGDKLTTGLTVEQIYNKTLIAPTGSGKTFLVNTCNDWSIIVCPTTALCENIEEEYGAYYFNAKDRFEFDNDLDRLSQSGNRIFISVTYDSFKKLTTFLIGHQHKFRIFIDESHNFTLAANYRLKALTDVIKLSDNYKSKTFLTGTYVPCFHPAIMEMPIIQAVIPRAEIQAELLECSDILKTAQYLANQSIKDGRFPLILFNSKNTAGQLGTLKMYLKDSNFAFFNSNTKQEKDWELLTSKGMVAARYKGLCTTSVLKEGNNIYNENDFDIIIIGNFHSAEIEQFSRRPRKPKSVKIYKLVGQNRPEQKDIKSIYGLGVQLLYKSIASCNELNTGDGIAFELLEKEFFARQAIAALPISLTTDGEYQTDYLRLSNFAFKLDIIQENRNINLLRKRLAKYGIILGDPKPFLIEKDKGEAAEAKESREAKAAAREQAFDKLLLELEGKEIFTYSQNQLSYHTKALTIVEKKVFKQIKSLSKLMGDKQSALEVIKESKLSDARFKLFRRQYVIQLLINSDSYMKSNRKFAIVLKAMYNTFKEGAQLTGSEIRNNLLRVLQIDKGIDLERLERGEVKHRNNKALSVFKLFFEVERKKVRGRNIYTVGCIKRNYLFNNKTHFIHPSDELTKEGHPKFLQELLN